MGKEIINCSKKKIRTMFQVDPNDPNYDSDSSEPKGPSANGTKRTIKLNTMVNHSGMN